MRELADAARLRRFLAELGRSADEDGAVFLTGGATAVLIGWRETTIDADILIVPETDAVFRAVARLKEELRINVEIASPAHFIPELSGGGSAACSSSARDGCPSITMTRTPRRSRSSSAGMPRTWPTCSNSSGEASSPSIG